MDHHRDHQERLSFIIGFASLAGALAGLLIVGAFSLWMFTWLDQGSTSEAFSQREIRETITELQKEEVAIITIVERVSPAVVSVTVRKPATEASSGSPMILFNGQPLEESVSESTREDGLVDVGEGTAFFVDPSGVLLTNRHVVEDVSARYFITTSQGDEIEVDVVARDTLYDVAVMRVKSEDMPEGGFETVTLAEDQPLQIGQTVIAVGNALGEFSNTVTKGIVSGINRDLVAGGGGKSEHLQEAIQTDAAINPGNSGGPLVNLNGEVIGINTAVSSRGSGLGFAIPISVGRKVVKDVLEFGHIVRPWLGVRYVMLSDENAQSYGFPKLQRGAYILPAEETGASGVVKGSPAEIAGLREGDVIVKVNEEALTEDEYLSSILNTFKPGDVVSLLVLREGDTSGLIEVTLGEFDPDAVQ